MSDALLPSYNLIRWLRSGAAELRYVAVLEIVADSPHRFRARAKPDAGARWRSHDCDLRSAVRREIAECLAPPGIAMEEFWVPGGGDNRADLAVVDTKVRGFELKSASDSLARLPSQVIAFGRVFDFMTLVADSSHLHAAETLVPGWWGITEACAGQNAVTLRQFREPKRNPKVDRIARLMLLWHCDLVAVASQLGLTRVERMPKARLRALLSNAVADAGALDDMVAAALRSRPRAKASLAI